MATIEEQLELHEDIVLKPYLDTVGKTSIGVGRNLDDVGISKEEARILLHNDIRRAKADLDRALPWWRSLDPVRQKVMIDMCFNMGIGNDSKGLLSFKNTLKFIQQGEWVKAATNMESSKWARQVGNRSVRLARMMRTGEDYAP